MNYRCLVASWAAVAVVSLASPPAVGQERPSASGAGTGIGGLLPPADSLTLQRTPWGDPDLQADAGTQPLQ